EVGTGILNMSGTPVMTLANNGIRLGVNANASGIVNLGGGTLTTNRVGLALNTNNTAGTTIGLFNFHGGTLKANTNNTTFLTQGSATAGAAVIASTIIWAEGGTIDDGGFAITATAPLANPTGN